MGTYLVHNHLIAVFVVFITNSFVTQMYSSLNSSLPVLAEDILTKDFSQFHHVCNKEIPIVVDFCFKIYWS